MIKNNSLFFYFQQFAKRIKKTIKLIQKFGKKNRNVFQRFQITSIYFCAVVVLMFSVRNSLGFFPEMLYDAFPFLTPIFDWPFLRILVTPEKTFFLYLLIIEFIITRNVFRFSILVKFNVLLILILEMLQNLIGIYYELLFVRDAEVYAHIRELVGPAVVPKLETMYFFSLLFIIFFGIYMYAFFQSFFGRIPVYPGPLRPITDSVAFWLQLRRRNNKT